MSLSRYPSHPPSDLSTGPLVAPVRRSMLSAPAAGGPFRGGALTWRLRPRSSLASPPASSGGEPEKERLLLVERYRDGVTKRYMSDGNSKLQIRSEKHESPVNAVEDENADSLIPQVIRDFVLPAGFPGSVTVDYLEYMLLQFPTNVTGWICNVLVTSSLLKIGTGCRCGVLYRNFSSCICCCYQVDALEHFLMMTQRSGGCMPISLEVLEGYFLPLASLGNLAKAVARGFKDPSFRVIQNHFAQSGNLGEVAAKEEVWEVGAQLLGLSIGVLIMDTAGVKSSYLTLTSTWLIIRLLHLWLRYQSLSVLKFRTINLKRGRILVRSHVAQHTVPGYVVCNEEENILTWERFLHPQIFFGVPMERMLGGKGSSDKVNRLLKLYKNEKYVLFVEQFGSKEPTFLVAFKEAANSMSVLRSLWQAHWLQKNRKNQDEIFSWLEDSILALEHGFTDFLEQMERAGWDQNQIILKVPKEPVLVLQHLDQEV